MATITMNSSFFTLDFWPSFSGVIGAPSATTFEFQGQTFLSQQTVFVRVTGNNFAYNGSNLLISGTYTKIEVFSDNGFSNLIATFNGTGDAAKYFSSGGDQFAGATDGLKGNDTITGSSQNDFIWGMGGADNTNGAGGNDTFLFGPGEVVAGEIINGGAGSSDTITPFETVDFRAAQSIIGIERIGLFDLVAPFNNTAIFNASQLAQLPSNLLLSPGSGGTLTIDVRNAATFSAVNWTFQSWTANDKILISGTAANNTITGSSKNDTISGLDGNDTLNGGAGLDTLLGGAGNDKLNGGSGGDTMNGGAGNDTYFVDSAGDTLIDSGGVDTVMSTASRTLATGFEKLTLQGSGAINGTGNAAANTITGNSGKNTLSGLGGNDTLNGGGGDDILRGGTGKDILNGGAGKDKFDFNATSETKKGTARDQIKDFKRGQDKIDLFNIDANTKAGGNQKFKFIGEKGFSKTAGELRFKGGIVQGDVNGDGKVDFEIKVDVSKLAASDFVL